MKRGCQALAILLSGLIFSRAFSEDQTIPFWRKITASIGVINGTLIIDDPTAPGQYTQLNSYLGNYLHAAYAQQHNRRWRTQYELGITQLPLITPRISKDIALPNEYLMSSAVHLNYQALSNFSIRASGSLQQEQLADQFSSTQLRAITGTTASVSGGARLSLFKKNTEYDVGISALAGIYLPITQEFPSGNKIDTAFFLGFPTIKDEGIISFIENIRIQLFLRNEKLKFKQISQTKRFFGIEGSINYDFDAKFPTYY